MGARVIMTMERKIIRVKVGLLELAKQLDNVGHACKIMGYSRDSLYRQISRKKLLLKNRVPQESAPATRINSAFIRSVGRDFFRVRLPAPI